MKTKTIFKALALAMLMPATMLNTACSSEDDAIINNDETPAKKSYTLPLTINVTREGDDATTRATYNESTKKLEFSAGDKLLVTGYYDGSNWYDFAGTLDWVSDGTFSGTITSDPGWTGTALELLEAAASDGMASATLLPAGYDDPYSFLSIKYPGTSSAYVSYNFKNAFATSKAAAVAQFSYEQGDYSSGTGFVLHPSSAILNFTITGLTANKNVTASLEEESGGELVSGAVTTDALGTATFAMGVKYGNKMPLTLTVDGNPITITSDSKTFAKGHVYNILKKVGSTPSLVDAFTEGNTTEIVFDDILTLSATFSGGSFGAVAKSGNYESLFNSASMARSGNNLVITVEYESSNGPVNYTMTINTATNTYTWSNATFGSALAPTAITIGGNSITPLPTAQ